MTGLTGLTASRYTITTITIFGILCLCGYDTKNEVGVVSVPRGIIGATFYAEITLDQKAKSFLNEGQNVVSDIQDLNNSVSYIYYNHYCIGIKR